MEQLSITPDIEQKPWTDLEGEDIVVGTIKNVGAMPNGTISGHPAVMLHIELPDGTPVIVQTTLRLFATASDAMIARHGDPREQ